MDIAYRDSSATPLIRGSSRNRADVSSAAASPKSAKRANSVGPGASADSCASAGVTSPQLLGNGERDATSQKRIGRLGTTKEQDICLAPF